MRGGEEGARRPAARLLSGRSGSSPPRAARRPQPRPGHVSRPPPPPAGLVGSQPSGGRAGCGQGRGPREERGDPPEDPRRSPGRGAGSGLSPGRPGVPAAGSGGIPAGRGRKAGGPARPGGSEGPRLAAASPGLSRGWARAGSPPGTPSPRGTCRPRRAEGTRGGAGFWASRELCPLSCSKKPNQKANLQASQPNVTLSAGSLGAAPNDKPRIFILARRGGIFR